MSFNTLVCLVHTNCHPSLVCGQYDYVLVCFQSFLSAFCSSGVKLLDKTDYNDSDILANDRPTKYLNETQQPHCNANLTTNCLHWRKPPRSTFDATKGEVKCSASSQAVWATKTIQTQHNFGAHSFFLWVPDLPTV